LSARAIPADDLASLWDGHTQAWRDPVAVVGSHEGISPADPALLRSRTRGPFWSTLERLAATLVVSREYEHLLLGLAVVDGRPHVTHLSLPHPSGLAYDKRRGVLHVALTRNPNQIMTLAPVVGVHARGDRAVEAPSDRPLVPRSTRFLPGCLYLHDLAMIGGDLHANAVGENAVLRIDADGEPSRVWWPRAIERPDGPDFGRNYLQLNSIAAGPDLAGSYFSASTSSMSARRPGHRDFPVDGRGVVFSGATREPVAGGLTRPHSARLHGGRVWVDNSGYGELGVIEGDRFEPLTRLPGWTRGLCVVDDVAFVGTSRVIPRFAQYAPGLDVDKSECAVHAIDLQTGASLGSLHWPRGNQIFAIEAVPAALTRGLPLQRAGAATARRTSDLFYSFELEKENICE
jgi:uncharacterized protein (TIGR03032 family)